MFIEFLNDNNILLFIVNVTNVNKRKLDICCIAKRFQNESEKWSSRNEEINTKKLSGFYLTDLLILKNLLKEALVLHTMHLKEININLSWPINCNVCILQIEIINKLTPDNRKHVIVMGDFNILNWSIQKYLQSVR